jgi:hypothetical protein
MAVFSQIRRCSPRLSRFTHICKSEYGSKLLGNREHGPHELRDLKIALARSTWAVGIQRVPS